MPRKTIERRAASAPEPQPIIPQYVLLTGEEVCRILRVCAKTLFNMRKNGDIRFVRRRRTILFRRIDVEAYLRARLVEAA